MTRTTPPWLNHLRRDRRGLPVPHINLWGNADDSSRFRIEPDPYVNAPGICFVDDYAGDPDFTKQSFQRQRESMLGGLCQVCGRPVPWRRRLLALGDLSVETVQVDGKTYDAVTEPWLDTRCAEFALTHCPALIRRRREENLILVQIESKDQVTFTISTGYVDGPLRAESLRQQPAMFAKALLGSFTKVASIPSDC